MSKRLDMVGLVVEETGRGRWRSTANSASSAQQNAHAKSNADLYPLHDVSRWTWPDDSE